MHPGISILIEFSVKFLLDFDYMQKESQRENNELNKLQSQLTETQQQEIIENAKELKRRQELTQGKKKKNSVGRISKVN